MSFEDNLLYAQYADKLDVDVLEAGFPTANQGLKIVQTIATNITAQYSNIIIAVLCQFRRNK